MKKNILAVRIWEIVYPFLFYYAVMLVTMYLAQRVIGSGSERFVICQMIASAVTIPFMLPFYRQDQALRGIPKGGGRIGRAQLYHVLWAIAISACISISLNNLISMTSLVEVSEGYREANANFYGGTLVWELLSSALVTPILEELVFRGILFGRLRDRMKKPAAIALSSLLFAVMHFNVVQFIYALAVGAVLALLMDEAGHMYAAVAGHITANAIAVIRTETGMLEWTMRRGAPAWGFSGALLMAGLILLFVHHRRLTSERVIV